jgi:hypothetical protein
MFGIAIIEISGEKYNSWRVENFREFMRGINILVIPPFKIIAFRKGRVAAIIATAKKIAIIIWNMIINN